MALEGLIFAVDGVIAETHEARREAFNEVFCEAGLGWTWDRSYYAELLRYAGDQELVASAMIRAFLKDRIVRHRSSGDLANLIAAMERRHASLLRDRFISRRVKLRPGIVSILDVASKRGLRLAVVTRDDGGNVRTLLETCLPLELSRAIEIVATVPQGLIGNEPNAYAEAAALLDIESHRCLVIESSSAGLAVARGAGMAGLITWGLYPRIDEITSPSRDRGHASSIAEASNFFLSRWDCAPATEVLSYIGDVHSMQRWLLHPSNIFTPASVTLEKEVHNVGLRYLEA